MNRPEVQTYRSKFLSNEHRFELEQEFLKPLETGGMCGGLSKTDLVRRKLRAIGSKNAENRELPQDSDLIAFLESDGIFIDNAIRAKNEDLNVQKLEERLINSNQKNYFMANGEVKLDIDLLANERTRPADLAFEQSDAF